MTYLEPIDTCSNGFTNYYGSRILATVKEFNRCSFVLDLEPMDETEDYARLGLEAPERCAEADEAFCKQYTGKTFGSLENLNHFIEHTLCEYASDACTFAGGGEDWLYSY